MERWEQLARLSVPDISILNEPYLLQPDASASDLQAEPDHTFHGEFFDTMDAITVAFELEDARRMVAESEKGTEHIDRCTEGTSVPDQDGIEEAHQRKKFIIHSTCASAYALLLQRRCTSLREVLAAASRRMDEDSSEEPAKMDDQAMDVEALEPGMEEEEDAAADPGSPYPLVQQLLCSFIELASKIDGEPAVHALRTVGELLANQQPLVLANERATWLMQLLDWLQQFLALDSGRTKSAGPQSIGVRGVAVGAMLDLGVCSGSLRCALLTVESLLTSVLANDTSIDCQHVVASVGRLQKSSTKSMSSPCGCATTLVPLAHLQDPRPSSAPRKLAKDGSLPGSLRPPSMRHESATSKANKFVSIACDGQYLYVLSPDGLTKYGTGYMGTTLGNVYSHMSRYQTQRPWLACIGTNLYLRSYAMAPDCLVVVDTTTLEEVGVVNPSSPESIPLHADGSASAMFPEKGLNPGDAGGSHGAGDGGGGDGPSTRHSGAAEGPAVASSEMEVVDASESEDPAQDATRSSSNTSRDILQHYRENLARGRTSIRQRASSVLEHLTASRSAGRTAAPGPPHLPSRSHGMDLPGSHDADGRMDTDVAPGAPSAHRSPVVSDGRYLYVIAKSDKPRSGSMAQPPSHQNPNAHDVRDEDDESSEGGGPIGSTWDDFNFTIDTFDAQDGMRHVRNVSIQGPPCDYGLQEGDGLISCCVCGLVMTSTAPGYRCMVCNPDYDLCNQCFIRGAYSRGHKPHHQTRAVDWANPPDVPPPGVERVHMPAFPAKCLEYQSFYTDGKMLMVIIPPELCTGYKIPGLLCRIFDIEHGHHLYDISLADSLEEARKDIGVLTSGGSCYDPVNDLVWNVELDGLKVRRWRHPWTVPIASTISAGLRFGGNGAEGGQAADKEGILCDVLECLYKVAQKHARCVKEPRNQMHQSWAPFCIEALPSTFTLLSSIVDSCVKRDKVWFAGEGSDAQTRMDVSTVSHWQLSLKLIRTCMRLVVVNVGRFAGMPGNEDTVVVDAMYKLKTNIMLIAECRQEAQSDLEQLFNSTISEATDALTAGFDTFFPTADEQAQLLIQLLKGSATQDKMRDAGRGEPKPMVLEALSIHLAKPAASNLVFSIFDGRWLEGGQERVDLAQELLLLLLERAHFSSLQQGAVQDTEHATANSDCVDNHLLELVAAFQRHLLSIPMSSRRSNAKSEALMLFFAQQLLDHAMLNLKKVLEADKVNDGAAQLIRTLLPPLATALTDKEWSQHVSSDFASEILPRLDPLLKQVDQLNIKFQNVRAEDEVFSAKGTEARFIGGRIISIARNKGGKVSSRAYSTKVHVPGASHMLIRITEDVTLTKKEQLKLAWEPREPSSSREKHELVIKGSQRGKRIWRSFRCPGDTVSIQYTRTALEDMRGFRNIRLAVYGCARNAAMRMPLNWLLDLELTLASLTAKLMWSSFGFIPSPVSPEAAPWISTCSLFSGGLDHDWLALRCPELVSPASQFASRDEGAQDKDAKKAEVVVPSFWSSDSFTSFLARHLERHVKTPDWLRQSFFCAIAQHIAAGLIKVSGLTREADGYGQAWKSEAEMPENMQYVLSSSVRIVQGLIMDVRKKLQTRVTGQSKQVVTEDEMAVDGADVGDGPGAPGRIESDEESVDSVKLDLSRQAEGKARQIMERSWLLMAAVFDDKDGKSSCAAAAAQLTPAERERCRLPHNLSMDEDALAVCGIDLAARFLIADVPAHEIVGIALESCRVLEERKSTLRSMSRLLKDISLTSVRQVLLSSFVACPCPVETQRMLKRFDALDGLSICTKQSRHSVQIEVEALFTLLASSIDSWVGVHPVNRSEIAMTHLILNALQLLQLQARDAAWLVAAGVLEKLCNIIVNRSSGHLLGASPFELQDAAEQESLLAVRDAGFNVLSMLTSALARLHATSADEEASFAQFFESAVAVAGQLVKGVGLHPPSDTRDVIQSKILIWLYDLTAHCRSVPNSIVKNAEVRHAVTEWCLNEDSPQVQRVAMKLLTRVMCSDTILPHGVPGGPSAGSECGASLPECLRTASGESLVQVLLTSVGRVLGAQGVLQAPGAPARADEPMCTSHASASASASDPETGSGKQGQWMVMVWPLSLVSSGERPPISEVEQACKTALEQVRRYESSSGAAASTAADTKAKQVASALMAGEKACAFVGSYGDCQTVSCTWNSSFSFALTLKTGNTRDVSTGVRRWKSGHVMFSLAQQQMRLLAALYSSPVVGTWVAAELLDALSDAAARWGDLASNPTLHLTKEIESGIHKGLAVIETISGKIDPMMQVGSQVKLRDSSCSGTTCSRGTSAGGVVVRCDHLMGSISVLPHTVFASKSLQSVVATNVSIEGSQGLVAVGVQDAPPFLLSKTDAAAVLGSLAGIYDNLQAISNLQNSGMSAQSRWCLGMQSRSFCALSHMMQHGLLEVKQVAASGILPALLEHAAENASSHDVDGLELRRSNIASALCEPCDRGPTALLAAARAPGPGGGGGGGGSGSGTWDSSGGGGGGAAGSGASARAQRLMPSVESFMRTSRATQRQDQRRSRELAAAELAEISRQPIRLCQLALERENGNQDRAANWLFEHGESFLAENPEFGEVPEGAGETGPGGDAGGKNDELPLFLLHDAFSYYDDMQASVLGSDSHSEQAMGAISALSAGIGNLPEGMLDEFRALGHIPLPSDDGIRMYEERMLGGQPNPLGRSRGASLHTSAAQRRDEPVRAGGFVTLTEMDLLGDPCHPYGKQMVGKILYVESLDRTPDGQQARLTLYDSVTGTIQNVTVPAASVEHATHYGTLGDCDLVSDDAKIKASVEVDGKLASVHARSCLRWMLEGWPDDESFEEASLGGRQRLIRLAQAAALGSCCSMSDIPNPAAGVRKLASDASGQLSLSSVLQLRVSGILARHKLDDQRAHSCVDAHMASPSPLSKQKREREVSDAANVCSDDSEAAVGGRDKRRRCGLERSDEPSYTSSVQSPRDMASEFQKPHLESQPALPLIDFFVDECIQALKAALADISTVEHASEHPYVRSSSNTGSASRRCLHVENVWALLVVFDSRCSLLPGESLRFFSDAACTDVIATACMDDRRKGYLPLVLPSPVWMQLSTASSNDDGDHNWGFRVQAFPLGGAKLMMALWLAQLVLPHRHNSRLAILEALLDLLDKSAMLAAPHSMQAHRLVVEMMQQIDAGADSHKLLSQHPSFAKMMHEATLRRQWESTLPATGGRHAGESTVCPHSKYLCSMAEVLATRSLAIPRISHGLSSASGSCDLEQRPHGPEWLQALEKAMSIMACMYCGKQQQLEGFVEESCSHFGVEELIAAGEEEEEVKDAPRLLEQGQLSAQAREALSELFSDDPNAAAQLACHLRPPQAAAHNKRDFLQQAQTLAVQDQHKLLDLIASFGADRFLVRWGPDRDADLVALVNMLTETEHGLISPLDESLVGKMKLTEYHHRKLPRLASVPHVALQRRLMLLKLLNFNMSKCMVVIDFSRRCCQSSFAASVCELQHLIFHQTKAALHNAVIDWTTCAQPRAGTMAYAMLSREVLVHRPGRRARDNKEKAEDHERWRLQITAANSDSNHRLEEFLVAPSDFGSAREMPADANISARLVPADPPNGSLPFRNSKQMRGNIALIERGGGQFVNVVRRAQEAGAIGVVLADSKEGPLFLMSTELGNSGDDVTIPAVLLSLADSMLLWMRQRKVTATISADGVFMQTYRQLRYAPAARLRQRDEMAWRVKFQGEGHQGHQGPYREAISALCAELQSEQLNMLVPCANASGSVGENRDKFVPRPSACSDEALDVFFFIGQLMGVAMRTRNLLNLDLPSMVWKSLVGIELDEDDLKATDFSCWNALQFRDHNGQAITAKTFSDLLHQCRFTCCLTDGSEVPLLPGGHAIPVTYQRRSEYARLVIKTRLCESERQLAKMRAGLCSVIPEQLLGFMTWEELERRVCGSPEVDISSLKRHTQYRQGVDKDSPHVKMFWEVLEDFCQADRRLFLRFAWGRERLPLESEYPTDHDMKVFPSDRGDGDKVLPEAETCFFIVKLPRYRTKELMRQNLYAAITACREINY